jgi:hypothetical protein
MLFFVANEPYLLLAAGASLNIFWQSQMPYENVGFTPELYAIDIGSILDFRHIDVCGSTGA